MGRKVAENHRILEQDSQGVAEELIQHLRYREPLYFHQNPAGSKRLSFLLLLLIDYSVRILITLLNHPQRLNFLKVGDETICGQKKSIRARVI